MCAQSCKTIRSPKTLCLSRDRCCGEHSYLSFIYLGSALGATDGEMQEYCSGLTQSWEMAILLALRRLLSRSAIGPTRLSLFPIPCQLAGRAREDSAACARPPPVSNPPAKRRGQPNCCDLRALISLDLSLLSLLHPMPFGAYHC